MGRADMGIQHFIYVDAKGEMSARTVDVSSINEEYLEGFCLVRNAFRTFRRDRILEFVVNPEKIHERLLHHSSQIASTSRGRRPRADDRVEICMDGFSARDKQRFESLASNAGMTVVGSITKRLRFLCVGPRPSSAKINLARQQRAIILTENQFHRLLETGEIPDQSRWTSQEEADGGIVSGFVNAIVMVAYFVFFLFLSLIALLFITRI
jgi:hypothetical protein